jgi:hypothetical protein
MSLIKSQKMKEFTNYMKFKLQQINNNSYSPDKNDKKYLLVMACHCDSELKLETIRKNLRFFAFENVHKVIVNSQGLPLNSKLSEICYRHINSKYCEIPNSPYIDFGKWAHVLKNEVSFGDYDYVILTNDSYTIENSINHFLNLAFKFDVDLFGYNDSTQVRYHYQSYLFCLKKDAVPTFVNKVANPNLQIKNQLDVINNFEINMTDWFPSQNCFLKIGNFGLEKGHNIFFTNDQLYEPLKKSHILPFTKLKRIT